MIGWIKRTNNVTRKELKKILIKIYCWVTNKLLQPGRICASTEWKMKMGLKSMSMWPPCGWNGVSATCGRQEVQLNRVADPSEFNTRNQKLNTTGTLWRRKAPSFTTLSGRILGVALLLSNKKNVVQTWQYEQSIKWVFLTPGFGVFNHDLGVVLGLKGERLTVQWSKLIENIPPSFPPWLVSPPSRSALIPAALRGQLKYH